MARRWVVLAGGVGLPVALLCARLQSGELWPQHGLVGWALGMVNGGVGLFLQVRSIGRGGTAFMRLAVGSSMFRFTGFLGVLVLLRFAAPSHFGPVALAAVGMTLVFMVCDVAILAGMMKGDT